MKDIADFSDRELGILCVLLLRGPQTVGEIRSRTTRLAEFHGLAAVEHTLRKLIDRENGPFVQRIDRRPGQKEDRYCHLFSAAPEASDDMEIPETEPRPLPVPSELAKVDDLEKKVDDLRRELEGLKERFEEFKRQFE